jgi:dephospho-CoA kinase
MKFREKKNWPHVYVIGLTGGIATGKSTISSMLRRLGAFIVDADVISHEVTGRGQKGLKLITERYGSEVLNPDGTLNRRHLGKIVFSDRDALDDLNAIVHPLVLGEAREKLSQINKKAASRATTEIAVFDAPLLFESGAHVFVDEVWVVSVDRETQIRRVMTRDGYSREQAIARIDSQMPLEEKIRRADVVIDTAKDIEETRREVTALWDKLQRNESWN